MSVWNVTRLHPLNRRGGGGGGGRERLGTLQSDNGDVHENVAEK